jgi:8-oxo-dGTP pyrophosphatase MutT (NUDIX family)
VSGIDHTWYVRPEGVRDRFAAGGVVVRLEASRVLVALAQEAGMAEAGHVLPKGGLDPGEDTITAARREIAEEAGLTELTLLGRLATLQRLTYYRDRWQVIYMFLFVTHQVDGTPTDTEHHEHLWWFPLDELPEMLWPEQRRLLEDGRTEIERALRLHLSAGPVTGA